MNKLLQNVSWLAIALLICAQNFVSAQSFTKGSLLISLSEGAAHVKYTTTNLNSGSDVTRQGNIAGDRDPITIEYGLTKHIGIGLNLGTDIFNVNPSEFYDFKTPSNKVKAFMSEVTVDGNYHFLSANHTDLSAFASVGMSSVSFSGNDGDRSYTYNAGGSIIRIGTKAKYYFRKRFGVHGMLSVYSANCSPVGVKGNTVGNDFATSITGYAIEFGFCYRLLH